MKTGVPWRVKGIRTDARETAREAARRAGMSVGEWLNTVIIDSADEEGIRLSRRGYDDDEDDSDEMFGVHERLDELTRQLGRIYQAPPKRAPYAPAATGPEAYAPPSYNQNRENNQLAEAIARLDRRMEELVNANRSVAAPAYAPAAAYAPAQAYAPEPRASGGDAWTADIDQAMAEIAARQQALDADPDAPAPPPTPAPQHYAEPVQQHAPVYQQPPAPAPMPSQNLSGLEQHLRHITGQIEALRQQPQLEEGIAALRQALSDIARTLLDAMPRRAIEALEGEIHALTARLDNTKQAGVDTNTLASLEHGLAEVRDTLRTLTPAENLAGFREAVHSLAQKVEMLGTSGPDMSAFQQLETAIASMQGIVSHVASNEALQQLAGEVHALAEKVDHVASAGMGAGDIAHSQALEILDQRDAHIADALESRVQNGGSVPPQLEAVISGLSEKIERLQHSRGEDVSYLESQIAGLVEKLDASGARFAQLEAIERGLADLLNHIEQQHANNAQPTVVPQMDGLQRDIMRTQTSLEAVHGTLGHVVDRLAMLETDMRGARTQPQQHYAQPQPEFVPQQQYAPHPQAYVEPQVAPQPQAYTEPQAQDYFEPQVHPEQQQFEPAPQPYFESHPDPEFQPQMPPAAQLEVPAFAAEPRMFGQEPAAELAPPPSREVAHAQAAAAMARANPRTVRTPIDPDLPPDEPLEPGVGSGRGRSPADRITDSERALGPARRSMDSNGGNKSNFIAAARRAAKAAASEPTTADLRAAASSNNGPEEKGGKSFGQRMRQLFVGASVILIVGGGFRVATNLMTSGETPAPQVASSDVQPAASTPAPAMPSMIETQSAAPAIPHLQQIPTYDVAPSADVTGSVRSSAAPYGLPPSLTVPGLPSSQPSPRNEKLPAAIGSTTLRNAAQNGDAAAEYEVAVRYAEGQSVAANPPEAARWFELAARQGLAMAQFRLAALYEKGVGVKKDTETARRLYKTAAEQGNAKAMHNLAVLYAEGAAVKPDYRTAAQWFRLAADHGVSDSQYNLAILYARGIGVDQNLVESYKWFALAADQGDQEAAKKRDEVTKRLDATSLKTAKLAVKAFAPQDQPEAATMVRMPAGGWDAASSTPSAPAPAKPKRAEPVRVGAR